MFRTKLINKPSIAGAALSAFFFALIGTSCPAANEPALSTGGLSVEPKTYELWEPTPAPNRGHQYGVDGLGRGYPYDIDWERWSYPLGNGMIGANVFGRTDLERIQLSEKTFANGSAYGRGSVTNAAELYLDFGHRAVSNYRRALNLNDAIKTVTYQSGGVSYQREYFTSYPDDIMVIHLTADQPGALSLTVRPEIPYLEAKNDLDAKSGTVAASGDTITLAGMIDYYQVNYEIQVKVLLEGGKLDTGESSLRVRDADTVTLLVAVDTNYELGPRVFLNEPKEKLDPDLDPHGLVTTKMEQATDLGFAALRRRHLEDYRKLFGRVAVNLNSEVSELPIHELLEAYRAGTHDPYLEELVFQYGRYLLIASSRETSLPAHLQGAWSQYEVSPWCAGYWHNINVQMNYWGAMSANLAETFQAYLNYFEAYKPKAQQFARDYILETRPEALSDNPADNGWILGTGANAYQISGRSTHSGPGTGGFTTQLFMEYYNFTQDEAFLRETGYPAMLEMSKFFDKTLYETEDDLLLISPSASPEIKEDGEYYNTMGCTYDQGFVWENHTNVLRSAEILGKKDPFLDTIRKQIPRLDPILVGSSGQIKEFREEDAYGEIGDPHHRHTSQLCPLYPGTLIRDSHPEWMEAASVTLDLRGKPGNGWATAHRMNLRARLKEAEAAHDLYQLFITEKAANNLWSMHPPFQIDGNFGVMAGVAEMLLQSHAGFIEPLPALPEAWHTGSFDGLVARGNFEIAAAWEKGTLTQLQVHSRSGRPCRLKVPGVVVASVVGQDGRDVAFDSDGSDVISFATTAGGVYSINLKNEKPNILIIYADDLGYGDLGSYNPGSKIPTPHLDRLAAQGMRFTDGHSSSGICTPSRYAMLTGRHHWRKFHGIVGAFEESVFDAGELTLPEMLQGQGYTTATIGKWHLGWDWKSILKPGAEPFVYHDSGRTSFTFDALDWSKPIPDGPLAHGFDYYFGDTVINFPPYTWIENDKVVEVPDRMMDMDLFKPVKEGTWEARPGPMVTGWDPYENIPTTTEKAIVKIHEYAESGEPFFLLFAFPSPHAPIIPNDAFDGMSDAGPYGDHVVETDAASGRLLQALEDAGVADNTIVIFTADNGPEWYAYPRAEKTGHWSSHPLRGAKRDIYEGGHRVPFIVKWPGVVPPGSVTEALISQIDLMGTLAAVLGVDLPDDQAGDSHNFLPVLRGEKATVRDTHIHNTFEDHFAIRHGDWVLIDAPMGYTRMRDQIPGWEAKRGYEADALPVELYKLSEDLGQRNNLSGRYPEKVAELRAMMETIQDQGSSSPRLKR